MEKRKHSPVFFFAASPAGAQTCWRPSADVYRFPRGWLLKFDLAGVDMEEALAKYAKGCCGCGTVPCTCVGQKP